MTQEQRNYFRAYYAEYRSRDRAGYARYQQNYYARSQRRGNARQNLFDARLALGWSQARLADAVGVSQATISKLETGALALEGFRWKDKLLAVLGVTA